MDVAVLLSFAAASLVLAAAPGPDILYVLAQSAQSGARAGLTVVIGLMVGCLIQTAAAAAALLDHSFGRSGIPFVSCVGSLACADFSADGACYSD